ncbi:alpha/beta fold hydrolase [Paraglaciecola marina]|uniref:alpha/beta fold hydrolase n=1 Tax=Paraglaciecola marina TaxID=2500157 RepID=UPI001EF0B72A|nr:alpha/beta hydrolase [Paraglaciecola marina]
MPRLFLFICLLTACERAQFKDQVTQTYGLADRSSEYRDLVSKNPKELSGEQLYNRALTLWDIPYRELKLPTSNGSAHVLVSGPVDGKPIVLLHGMSVDSTMWYPNIKALSEHYRVYAIDDIWGAGKSTPSHEDTEITTLVAWYFEVFELLQLQQINLIGASQGGWIATNLALSAPERFDTLVLLSPAQTITWLEPSLDILANMWFKLNPDRDGLEDNLETLSSRAENIDILYKDRFFSTIKNEPRSPILLDMQPFRDAQLSRLSMPVLLLVGDDDLVNDLDTVQQANKILPNVQAEIIQESGHFINADQADLVNKKILTFLQK